ncbi:MAG: ATP phosphoribosyltransferase, partial [Pseudomonadota bacterium]
MSLVLAIPSKGRLMEAAHDLFRAAGLGFTRDNGGRGYRARINGLDGVEVRLLSASEIAAQLSAGGVHLGITGEDLIRESVPDADEAVHFVQPLGFGHAKVVVAAPKAWI